MENRRGISNRKPLLHRKEYDTMSSKKKNASPDLNVLDRKWKILLKAKKHLAWNQADYMKQDQFEFICHAIGYVMDDEHYQYDSSGLVKIIEQRLFPYDTYPRWLSEVGIEYWKEPNYLNKLQFSRHNWLDHLIQEFKDKDE